YQKENDINIVKLFKECISDIYTSRFLAKQLAVRDIKAFFASKEASNQVFNVACGKNISINELWNHLRSFSNSNLAPNYVLPRQGDVKDSLADVSKAQKLLNYSPDISVKVGLKITWDWFNH
ncbi:MAG: LPS biosynthesis protein WbpP, partial [Bacteroidetes bacterium]|nr:LPS biosynthesis protein WbpP [Bacteroidota bacterium]